VRAHGEYNYRICGDLRYSGRPVPNCPDISAPFRTFRQQSDGAEMSWVRSEVSWVRSVLTPIAIQGTALVIKLFNDILTTLKIKTLSLALLHNLSTNVYFTLFRLYAWTW